MLGVALYYRDDSETYKNVSYLYNTENRCFDPIIGF